MGFYKIRESYWEGLSELHPLVRHNQAVSIFDDSLRRSFFRVNDEEELMAACINWAHFTCVVMFSLSGNYVNKGGSIRQNNINTLLFLDKMSLDASNPIVAPAITDAYDRTFTVMQDFIAQVLADYEDNPGCGFFYDIDLGKFKWEKTGPVGDQLYGWILQFSDETRAFADGAAIIPDRTNTEIVQDQEIIPFYNAEFIAVEYTTARRNRFGNIPAIEVWLFDISINSYYKDTSCEILTDAPPPTQTSYTVKPGKMSTGYITLSK